MQRPTILRIGICGCTRRYHRRFEGQTIRIHSLHQPLLLHEVFIPDAKQRETLRASRCHFFLDVHRDPDFDEYRTELSMNDILPGHGERLFIGGTSWHNWLSWDWCRPLTTGEILRALGRLISQRREQGDFARWLAQMNP